MEHNNSSSYRNGCLTFLAISALAWVVPIEDSWIYVFRIVPLLIVAFVTLRWLFRPRAYSDDAPDLLGERFGSYYESEGLCFIPVLSVADGHCMAEVYFQNRYERKCRSIVYVLPMEGNSDSTKPEVPAIVADIECGGGEFGVFQMAYPIAVKWQGKLMVYDVLGKVAYAERRGKMLRGKKGLAVGEPTSELAETLKMGAMLAFGHLRITHGASLELRLPENVSESAPAAASPTTKILWTPP